MRTRRAAAAVVLLLLSLALSVLAQGGGTVSNVAPVVRAFTSAAASIGAPTRLAGVVADRNGEGDLAEVRLHGDPPSGSVVWSNHTFTIADRALSAEPAGAVAGWRVWNSVSGDGQLAWSFEWTPAALGAYQWNLTVRDESLQDGAILFVVASDLPPAGPGAPIDTTSSSSTVSSSHSSTSSSQSVGFGLAARLAEHGNDLSWSLQVADDGAGLVHLSWADVPGALGYQVWRSTSPYILRAEIPAGQTTYDEPAPAGHAVYKVTYFTSRDAAGGWAGDGQSAAGIPGWDAGWAAEVGGAVVLAPASRNWWGWLVVAVAFIGANAGILLAGRGPGRRH